MTGTVIFCPNWLGDCVMAFPALEEVFQRSGESPPTLVVKKRVRSLLELKFPQVTLLSAEDPLLSATLRRSSFDCAYILPHSFRSAWQAFRGNIPQRRGTRGQRFRSFFLTDLCPWKEGSGHQALEYLTVVNARESAPLESSLTVPEELLQSFKQQYLPSQRVVVFIPGAQRGEVKQWPASHFIDLGKRLLPLIDEVWIVGLKEESALCELIAEGIQKKVKVFAGTLSFVQWVCALQQSALVVCNDSGGMHIADALHTPLIALFGITDPAATGPRASTSVVLQKSSHRSRVVPRVSEEALRALAAITPEEVYETAQKILNS